MKKVLYLDPDQINKVTLNFLISKKFAKVDITNLSSTLSGEDALRNNTFDLIISQIYPPAMINGLSIIENLRLGHYGNDNRNTPAIAHTSINLFNTAQECLEAGFDSFVPMPDSERRLLVEIQRLLNINIVDESDDTTSEKVFCLNLESSEVDKDLMRYLLKKEYGKKINLFQATSLEVAEEIMRNRKIDLVICDGPGSATFVKNLRGGFYGRHLMNLTVIICSGYANDGAKEKFIELGFSAYIPKPVNKQELIKTLTDHIPSLKN